MGEGSYRIVSEIEHARSDLDRDLDAFEARVRQETSLKVQSRRHPLLVLGCVVVLGFVVFRLIRSR